jgi:hypothetical protein
MLALVGSTDMNGPFFCVRHRTNFELDEKRYGALESSGEASLLKKETANAR